MTGCRLSNTLSSSDSRLRDQSVLSRVLTMVTPRLAGTQLQTHQPVEAAPLLTRPCTASRRAPAFKSQKRRKLNQIRHANNGSSPEASTSYDSGDLGERILSGEFTEEGSTREKLTRPIRKALAKDPIGPGTVFYPFLYWTQSLHAGRPWRSKYLFIM